MTANINDIKIMTTDGLKLAATFFEVESSSSQHATIIIVPAMGVHRHIYRRYSCYLAEQGFKVVTFDYRGMSGSDCTLDPRTIKMRDWATYDIASVIEWVKKNYPSDKLFVIAQSAGGQLVGLTPNNHKIDAMIALTSQSGYWGNWQGRHKWALFLLWFAVFPVLTRVCAHFPSSALGLGENIPSGVARQWSAWGRHPNYILSDEGPKYFEQFKVPILFLSFTDDPMLAPQKAIQALYDFYQNANREWRHIEPQSIGEKSIGHFGFLKDKFSGSLWQDTVAWLKQH